jgi:hypothetical protein
MAVWRYAYSLEGTEFMGGRLTGLLLNMKAVGVLLFIFACAMMFFYRRIAGAITILACLLCLPLYLYFAAPGLFRWLFGGEYSVPLRASFVWDRWTTLGIALLAVTTFFNLRILLISKDSNLPA